MIRGIRALVGIAVAGTALLTFGVAPTNAQPPAYQISLTKSHTPNNGFEGDPEPSGGSGSFSLGLQNTGANDLFGTFTVTDVLNSAFIPGTPTGSSWDCSASAGQTISCTVTINGNFFVAPSASLPAITVPFTMAPNASGTIANTASGSFTGGVESELPNLNISSNTDEVQILPPPQFTVTKTHVVNGISGGAALPGNTGTFSIGVQNTGSADIPYGSYTLTDTFNAGLTPGAASGTGWECATTGQLVECTYIDEPSDPLPVGTSLPIVNIPFTVSLTASGTISNTATVGFSGSEGNPPAVNASGSDQMVVVTPARFTLTKTHTPANGSVGASIPAGGSGRFNIVVSNTGTTATFGTFTVTDTLNGVFTVGAPSGTGWSCAGSSGQTVQCTITILPTAPLAAGASLNAIGIPVTVAPTASGTIPNTANVQDTFESLSVGLATGSDQVLISPTPTITLTKTHTPTGGTAGGSIPAGGSGAFHLVVTNAGLATISGTFTVTDSLNTAFTPGTVAGTGWNCAGTSGQNVSCTISTTLGVGASLNPISIPITVATTASGTIANLANVQFSGSFGNPPPVNATGTDQVQVSPAAQITLTKTHTPTGGSLGGPIPAGGTGAFSLVVTNTGSSPINGNFTVTDALNTAFVPGTASGSGWNCAGSSGQTVNCAISANLAAGASLASISIPVTIASAASDTITNSANAQFLASVGNAPVVSATGTDQIQISAPAQITLTKTHTPTGGSVGGTIPVGGSGAFSLVVTNTGSSPINGNFTVTDALNTAFVPGTASGSGWNCGGSSGQTVNCTISANLAAGASFNAISIPVTVATTASGTITNTASVQFVGSVGNPPAVHATGSDQIQIGVPAQITLTKTHTPTGGNVGGTIPVGGSGAFSLVVTNTGSAPANGNFMVTDVLNSAFVPGAISGSGWNCGGSSGQTVTCTISASLAAGASFNAISIPVTVATTASGTITNTASVQFVGSVGNPPAVHATGTDQVQIGVPVTTLSSPASGTLQAGSTGNVLLVMVGNSGNTSTSGALTLTYTLNAAFVPGAASGDGWVCSSAGQMITCTSSAALAPGTTSLISVPVNILASASGNLANTVALTGGNSGAPPTVMQTVVVAPLSITLAVPSSALSTVDASATITAQLTSALNATFVLTFVSNTTDPTPVCDEMIGINDSLVAPTSTATGVNCQVTTTLPLTPGSGAQTITIHTGSTAGTITVQIFAPSQPSTPVQQEQIVIAPAKPTIRTLTLTRSGNTLTVLVNPGYTNTRDLSNATFQFTAASGSTLQTSTITVNISSLAASFFQGPNGVSSNGITPGGAFSYSQTFMLTGDASTIASVTLTLSNSTGQQSDPATAQ